MFKALSHCWTWSLAFSALSQTGRGLGKSQLASTSSWTRLSWRRGRPTLQRCYVCSLQLVSTHTVWFPQNTAYGVRCSTYGSLATWEDCICSVRTHPHTWGSLGQTLCFRLLSIRGWFCEKGLVVSGHLWPMLMPVLHTFDEMSSVTRFSVFLLLNFNIYVNIWGKSLLSNIPFPNIFSYL